MSESELPPRSGSSLTAREREVLHWTAAGKSAEEVGVILNITRRTVNFHVAEILSKLGAVNKTHAVAIVLRASQPDTLLEVKKATEAEINTVAAAMWNDGTREDGRPTWLQLSAKEDAEIIADMKRQARAGLEAFGKLRGATD